LSAVTDAGVGLISPLLGHKSPVPVIDSPYLPGNPATTPEEARANVVNATGVPYYQPATEAGRATQAALTAGVSAVTNPASIPAALVGGATGQVAADYFPDHPLLANLLGFLAGSKATQKVGNLALPPTQPAGTTGGPSPEDVALAKAGTDAGVPVAYGQLATNPVVKAAYDLTGKLPFSGAAQFTGNVRDAWYRWVTGSFGENADRLAGPLFQQAETRIGDGLTDVAQRTPFPMSNDLMDKLQTASDNTLAGSRPTVTDAQMQILKDASDNNGIVSGDMYQRWTKRGGLVTRMQQSPDPEVRAAGQQFREGLDDELQTNAAPADVSSLQDLRSQWKALKTVEPLSMQRDTAGGAPSVGEINPANLQAAVGRSYKNAATASVGDIPLLDASRFAQRFMRPDSSGYAAHGVGLAGGGALIANAMENPNMLLDPKYLGTLAGTVGGGMLLRRALQSQVAANRLMTGAQNPGGFQLTAPAWQTALQASRPPTLP
jgi:hypothetical protein